MDEALALQPVVSRRWSICDSNSPAGPAPTIPTWVRMVILDRRNALEMIYRRAKQAGIATQIGCHTFRATGITIYLTNGGTLEKAQMMAAHSSPRTTKLYDRTSDAVSLDEVERVVF